jgi:hypothetical protein
MPRSAEGMHKVRAERFAKTQAALPEAQRLENRTDLALTSERVFAISTERNHEAARRWFQEYMKDCQPELYDSTYFETRGGSIYMLETFKAYAVYLSQTGVGLINDKLTVRTIQTILRDLFVQIERRRSCQFLKADKEDVKNFVENDLKNQEGLTTAMLSKPVVFAEYTFYILSVLYSRDFTAPPLRHQHHDLYITTTSIEYLLRIQCLSFHHLKLFILTLRVDLLQFKPMQGNTATRSSSVIRSSIK